MIEVMGQFLPSICPSHGCESSDIALLVFVIADVVASIGMLVVALALLFNVWPFD